MLEGSRWLTRLLDVLWHCVQFEWGSIGADVRYDTDLKRRKTNETGKTTAPLTPIGTVFKWKLEAREIHGFERQVIYNRQWNKEKKKKQVEVWRTLGDAVTVVCHLFINQTYLSFSLNCDLRPHLRRDLLVPPPLSFQLVSNYFWIQDDIAHPIWMHYVPQCRNERTNFHTPTGDEKSLFVFSSSYWIFYINACKRPVGMGGGGGKIRKDVIKSTLAIFETSHT